MSAAAIAVLFVAIQVFDGLFTYSAVQLFGLGAEGNPLLLTWMNLVGTGPALIGAKVLATVCGVVLYACGVHRVLLALTVLYGAVAVGPWALFFARL